MRKLLATLLLGAALTASADDFAYLNVVKTDGTGLSLSASSATISFADGYLVVGDEKILLTELTALRYSNEEISTTSIGELSIDDAFSVDDADAIYDLNGRQLDKNNVTAKGIYVIKKGSQIRKIQIK